MIRINKKLVFHIIKYLINILIFIYMIHFAVLRVDMSRSVGIDFDYSNGMLYDNGWFLNNALNYEDFNVFSYVPLIKNRSFIWILILFHNLKVSPVVGVSYFWVLAAILVFVLSKKITKSSILSFLLYLYTLFNPIGYYSIGLVSIYRNSIFPQTTIIYLCLLFILLYDMNKNKNIVLCTVLSILSGLSLFLSYFLTETGTVHLLVFSFFILLNIIFILYKYLIKKKKFNIKRSIVLSILPLVIFLAGHISYCFVNYRAYGVYCENMRTTYEVGRFISNLQDIESENQNSTIWCTLDQIDKAISVSNALKENMPFCEYIKSENVSGFVKDEGYRGDFVGWGITLACHELHMNYSDFSDMLKKANLEIETAFKYGYLKKTNKTRITNTLGRYNEEDMNKIYYITLDVLDHNINFVNLDNFLVPFTYDMVDKDGEFIEFFSIDKDYVPTDYSDLLKSILDTYRKVNIYLLNIALFTAILYLLSNINRFFIMLLRRKVNFLSNYNIYMTLFVGFGMITILYAFVISCFLIWFDANNNIFYYSSTTIAFYTISVVFMIAGLYCFIKSFKIFKLEYLKTKIKYIQSKINKQKNKIGETTYFQKNYVGEATCFPKKVGESTYFQNNYVGEATCFPKEESNERK